MNQSTRNRLVDLGIDPEASQQLLDRLNSHPLGEPPSAVDLTVPSFDGRTVLDGREGRLSLTLEVASVDPIYRSLLPAESGTVTLTSADLTRIGLALMPQLSFGLLNGGAATSFVDETKNRAAYSEYFPLLADLFQTHGASIQGLPKALAPGYFHADGRAGETFLELKLRSLMEVRRQCGPTDNHQNLTALLPWVQMVNPIGGPAIAAALKAFAPEYARPLTGNQNLLAALTPPSDSGQYQFFDTAYGKTGNYLGLPGGHGQVYSVMASIFKELRAMGKRFVYLGNIDNLGFTPNPAALAVAALTGASGLFEFSLKTAVDTKGGILVRDAAGQLTCADIGQAISAEAVARFEADGLPILFNCATGLFNLDYLVDHAAEIAERLPLRVSQQKKDAGIYCQAEQSAWEIIGIMPKPVILGTDKAKRFLASKFLLDSFLTSGLRIESSLPKELQVLASELNHGLKHLLKNAYGLG